MLSTEPVEAPLHAAARRGGRALPRLRPGGRVPLSARAQVHPCDASREQLFALRDLLGFERNVIVQATCDGSDNRALLDAIAHSNGRARGVASVAPDVSEAELH